MLWLQPQLKNHYQWATLTKPLSWVDVTLNGRWSDTFSGSIQAQCIFHRSLNPFNPEDWIYLNVRYDSCPTPFIRSHATCLLDRLLLQWAWGSVISIQHVSIRYELWVILILLSLSECVTWHRAPLCDPVWYKVSEDRCAFQPLRAIFTHFWCDCHYATVPLCHPGHAILNRNSLFSGAPAL